MSTDDIKQATKSLCGRLKETEILLRRVNEHFWADWMKKALSHIEDDDFTGIDCLLRAYGGMGSFNDLVNSPLNGHSGFDDECRTVNDELEALRSDMYDLAQFIRHAVAE